MKSPSRVNCSILFYLPNIVGYTRLVIVFSGHSLKEKSPALTVVLYMIFAALDGVDGWIARRLGQCSAFGAWLDVIVDNIGRTLVWSNFQWGFVISNLEWITYVCNHSKGSEWKDALIMNCPAFVNKVMSNGFKTGYGILAIVGLHVLPIWLFAWKYGVIYEMVQTTSLIAHIGTGILAAGRTLCAAVEMWCVYIHVKFLISENVTTSN